MRSCTYSISSQVGTPPSTQISDVNESNAGTGACGSTGSKPAKAAPSIIGPVLEDSQLSSLMIALPAKLSLGDSSLQRRLMNRRVYTYKFQLSKLNLIL